MHKYKAIPFIIIFVLIMVFSAAFLAFSQARFVTTRHATLSMHLASDGTLFEIIDTGDHQLALRSISQMGEVTGFTLLPQSEERGIFMAHHTLGLANNSLVVLQYETPGNAPIRKNKQILIYDLSQNSVSLLAEIDDIEGFHSFEVIHATSVSDVGAFIGFFSDDQTRLLILRIDVVTGEVSEIFNVENSKPLFEFSISESGELFISTRDSKVYKYAGGEWIQKFNPQSGEVLIRLMSGSDGLMYLFLSTPQNPILLELAQGAFEFSQAALDVSEFILLRPQSKNNWASLDKAFNHHISVDGEVHLINELRSNAGLILNLETLIMLLFIAFCTAIILIMVWQITLRRKIRLMLKLLIIIIPIFSIGIYTIWYRTDAYVKAVANTDMRNSVLQRAHETANIIDGHAFTQIDWDHPFDDAYFLELVELFNRLSAYRQMTLYSAGGTSSYAVFTQYRLYRVEGDKVFTALVGNYPVGLSHHLAEARPGTNIKETLLSQRIHPVADFVTDVDSEIVWLAIVYPIISYDELVGFVKAMRPMTAIEGLLHGVLREILMTGVVVLLTVVSAIIVVLAVTTGTLSNLKKGALAISGGNYSIRVKANAWDETGDIAKAFNAMASSVESSIDSISAVSDGYGRFVPDKLIEILGKKSITRIAAGDFYAKTTSHLLLYTDSFEALQNDEFFDAIGEFYSTVISDISDGDGLIARESANGVSAIFECLPQDTLQTVFCIQSALDKLHMHVDCYAFLGYSSIVLGVTGNEQYLNTITVSRLSYEYKSIGLLGKRFSARLIVSSDAYDKMGESTQQYRHRLLGYLTEKGKLKPLYDFYDCDSPEIRLKKEETRAEFELGVKLYYEKDFNKARTIFVDIIKIFPQDTASREYLLMSHMARENNKAPECLIEV